MHEYETFANFGNRSRTKKGIRHIAVAECGKFECDSGFEIVFSALDTEFISQWPLRDSRLFLSHLNIQHFFILLPRITNPDIKKGLEHIRF